ncbi:cbb3-type cytochrome oxidase assembly protein CcoS [Oceanisphaera sp. IT1-181]|uniref:cbb3-type cytochrome oxidase assembly protein CcoS n=1 Tax=Oceanisphaera sp. IT1-181 TaxID=3081199 RepID=UPI0029CA18E1|nr:cbb3-type cytochrome oxidase assembly protein CcoS [Oceanisphaera sp. IT1-181]
MTDDIDVWYFMIPVAMVFVGIAIALFFWSVKNDQFEDLDRHGSNILFDDDETAHQQAQTKQAETKKAVSTLEKTKEQDEHSA